MDKQMQKSIRLDWVIGLFPVLLAGALAIVMLVACSPAPARNRVTPGTARVEREVQGPSRWRIEIRQPLRVYVPTDAEVER
jgi:hypothetical protein